MTAPASIYPRSVADLLPAALEFSNELGELPSRNRLMREYRIGAPKAEELRDLLIKERVHGIIRRDREAESAQQQLRPLPDPVGSDRHEPGCACPICTRIAEARTTPDTDEPATPPVDPWDYAEPIGPTPGPAVPAPPDPGSDPVDIPLDDPDPTPVRPAVPAPVAVPDTRVRPVVEPTPEPADGPETAEPDPQVRVDGHPGTDPAAKPTRPVVVWPIILLAMPAFVAVWGGWVGLGGLTGFGKVNLLPGIGQGWVIDTAITLPIGAETYAAYALYVWLSGRVPDRARRFAGWSALGSLLVGAAGQVAYHLLVAAGKSSAPWWITMLVACLPVAVLGMGAALAHLVREDSAR